MKLRYWSALWVLLLAGALSCVPPEATYWKDQRRRPRPLPKLHLQSAWDQPLPFCPDGLSLDEGRVRLRGTGATAWIHSDGTVDQAVAASEPTAKAPDKDVLAALESYYRDTVPTTDAARWRRLAVVGVPEHRAVHAVNLQKRKVVWTVHTASRMLTAPQIYHSRVLLQGLDNYLYLLVADNGHEVWRAKASHRLTRPAVFWNDRVLVIPESSDTVEAFDLFDGSDAGNWSLPGEDDYFRGGPVMLGNLLLAPHANAGSSACRMVGLEIEAQPRLVRPGGHPQPTSRAGND